MLLLSFLISGMPYKYQGIATFLSGHPLDNCQARTFSFPWSPKGMAIPGAACRQYTRACLVIFPEQHMNRMLARHELSAAVDLLEKSLADSAQVALSTTT